MAGGQERQRRQRKTHTHWGREQDHVRQLKSSREETREEVAGLVPPSNDSNDLLFSCSSDNTIKVWRQSIVSDEPLSVMGEGTSPPPCACAVCACVCVCVRVLFTHRFLSLYASQSKVVTRVRCK